MHNTMTLDQEKANNVVVLYFKSRLGFYIAQIFNDVNRNKKDWIVKVLKDIKELKMNDDMKKIEQIKKSKFRNMFDRKIKQNVFEDLIIK